MRARSWGGALLVVVLAAGAAAGARACGKSGPSTVELSDYPPLEGTLCDVIAKAPPPRPHGPLPSEPDLAAWTQQVESGLEEALALEAIGEAHDYGYGAPVDERELACVRKLWTAVARKLPADYRLRGIAEDAVTRLLRNDGGSPTTSRSMPRSSPASKAGPSRTRIS